MNVYLCDKTLYSFLTAVFDAYREPDCVITSESDYQMSLGCTAVRVRADAEKAARVKNALVKYDKYCLKHIRDALRSRDTRREQVVFNYIKKTLQCKRSIFNAYNLDETVDFNDLLNKVMWETHKIKGFLRFKETASGALYAAYAPDNDITELIMPHFIARYKNQRFVIHDTVRGIAGVYNGANCIMGRLDESEIYLSENEKAFETLWKRYYEAVNIVSRPHEKQMKGYMPVRYWKFLPEKGGA